MSLLIPSSSAAPLYFSKLNIYNSNSLQLFSCNSFTPLQHRKIPHCKTRHIGTRFKIGPNVLHKYAARCKGHDHDSYIEEGTMSLDWDDEEEIEDEGTPWEGAVVYKRSASILHLEYCTALERLGLGNLSTDISKSRASLMGLRITKAVKDYPNGTPVQISIDVTRKKNKLRLDGIIKTVITLLCNRYYPHEFTLPIYISGALFYIFSSLVLHCFILLLIYINFSGLKN